MNATEFLKHLFEFCSEGKVEIRILPEGPRVFVGLDKIHTIANGSQPDGKGIYFGVATRDGQGGGKKNIVEIPAAWCDLDFKDTPTERGIKLLEESPLQPSLIVATGGGLHIYWRLVEPVGPEEIELVEQVNRQITTYFEADFQACDASRVLRAPDTLNWKYNPAKKVYVHSHNPFDYTLEDLADTFPEVKKPPSSAEDSKGRLDPNSILDGIHEGERDSTLFRYACKLRGEGRSRKEVETLVLAASDNCQPPFSKSEALEKVKSAWKYPDGEEDYQGGCEPENLDFPYEIMTGAAGEFAETLGNQLEPPRQFFYMSFIVCLGSLLADTVHLASIIEPQPRLYVLLLGESADDRKSTAIRLTVDFFKETLRENFGVCLGVASAEGLQERLKKDNVLLLWFDEFKQFISKCKIENSTLLPCVNTLFELNRYESITKKHHVLIEDAYLSLLAASTIDTYENTWSKQFTDIGFNNRLFLVPGSGQRKHSIPKELPREEKDYLRQRLVEVLGHVGEGIKLNLTPSAREIYDYWYLNRERSIHAKRIDTYTLRLMMLLAINELKTEIDEDIVRKSIALGDWQFKVRRVHDPIDAESTVAKMEEKIRRVLTTKGTLLDWQLKQHTNANKTGLWVYERAKANLAGSSELKRDRRSKSWFLKKF